MFETKKKSSQPSQASRTEQQVKEQPKPQLRPRTASPASAQGRRPASAQGRLAQNRLQAAQKAASTTKPKPPITREFSKTVTDTPYAWTPAFKVEKSSKEYKITVKVNLSPRQGVKKEQITKVKNNTQLEFMRHWDSRFKLFDKQGKALSVRVGLKYVTSGEHLSVSLHPGSARNNLTNWYVDSEAQTRAHELGHQLGMKDEYVDETAPNRRTATSPGVHTDSSIMGNYYSEGVEKADVKQRHGNVLAREVGEALGEQLKAGMLSTYTVRSGDTLKGLALRVFGNASKAESLYNINKKIIGKDKKIKPGMVLRLK